VGERLIRADANGSLHKEQPFVVELEGVLVQGVIDAYFEEDGKYIILDYKTDRLDTPEEFAERYKIQLDYYKKALEQITEKEVSETMIYSFRLGRGIKMSDKKYSTPEEVMGENWEEGLDEVEDEWE
jgi:ATP-dependent helicase/nuclease subunit A